MPRPNPSTVRGRVVATLAVAVVASLAVAAPASAAQVGTVPDLTWGISRAEVDRTVRQMGDAGIRTVRLNLSWSAIERDGKGVINRGALDDVDYAVDRAEAAGVDVLMPISDGVPYWASGDPHKYRDGGGGEHWNRLYRPRSFDDYADFVRFAVERYSARGVDAYEIWNEPNHPHFWPSGPSAHEYTAMLRAAYPAVKQANPSATVVLGGLSKSDYPYLERLYAAGARPYFDVAAVHPYTGKVGPTQCWNQAGTSRNAIDAFCAVREVRKVMVDNGDSDKPLWLTEMGWSTYDGEWGVSEAQQATYLEQAFLELEQLPYVKKAFIYAFRNLYWEHDDRRSIEANFGLVRTDFSPKPALAAVREYAKASGGTDRREETNVGLLVDPWVGPASTDPAPTHLAEGSVSGGADGNAIVTVGRYSTAQDRWIRIVTEEAPIGEGGRFTESLTLGDRRYRVRGRYLGSDTHFPDASPFYYVRR